MTVVSQQAFSEIQTMRRIKLGLLAPVILFVWKSERREEEEEEEEEKINSMSLWAFSVPANQHSPKQNTGSQLLLFLMEFQSKWPIREWNSNLATNSQSFPLSSDCTTKYRIIPARSICESLNRSHISFIILLYFVPLKTNQFLNILQNYKHDQSNIQRHP